MDSIFHHAKNKRSSSSLCSGVVTPTPSLNSARRASRTSSAVSAASSAVSSNVVAASTRPPSVLPHAAQGVAKARRVRLYRNGDTYYDGMVVVLAPDHFRTFDSILTFINRSPLADPSVLKKVSSAPSMLYSHFV